MRTVVDRVAPAAIESYTIITGRVALTAELLRLSDKPPPMGNTLVSNEHGPKQTLYLKCTTMQEMHPSARCHRATC